MSTTRRGFFGMFGGALAAVGVGRRGEAQGRLPLGQEPCAWDFTGNRCDLRYTECTFEDYDPALYSVGPTLDDCRAFYEREVRPAMERFEREAPTP